jgi:N-dimethylarginine dimethylaminohydrolase
MSHAVLMGHPGAFAIRSGANPHTRDFFGRRKKVNRELALDQWNQLKETFEALGLRVEVVPPVEVLPGLVFPANAGFRYGDTFYLSNLHSGRAKEVEHYRAVLEKLTLKIEKFPSSHRMEGEADFFPVGDPSGDPQKRTFLFTSGKLEQQRWEFRPGFPPYKRIYGFRSDRSALSALQQIVKEEILPLELSQEAHYHGDTVFYSFGPNREFLLTYLDGLTPASQQLLRRKFGDRIVPLSPEDGKAFGANSFQADTVHYGKKQHMLFMPDGLTLRAYDDVRARGVLPHPVDVSEFLGKGGGAIKCMLQDLGEIN